MKTVFHPEGQTPQTHGSWEDQCIPVSCRGFWPWARSQLMTCWRNHPEYCAMDRSNRIVRSCSIIEIRQWTTVVVEMTMICHEAFKLCFTPFFEHAVSKSCSPPSGHRLSLGIILPRNRSRRQSPAHDQWYLHVCPIPAQHDGT